jgi:hypothetical protein
MSHRALIGDPSGQADYGLSIDPLLTGGLDDMHVRRPQRSQGG